MRIIMALAVCLMAAAMAPASAQQQPLSASASCSEWAEWHLGLYGSRADEMAKAVAENDAASIQEVAHRRLERPTYLYDPQTRLARCQNESDWKTKRERELARWQFHGGVLLSVMNDIAAVAAVERELDQGMEPPRKDFLAAHRAAVYLRSLAWRAAHRESYKAAHPDLYQNDEPDAQDSSACSNWQACARAPTRAYKAVETPPAPEDLRDELWATWKYDRDEQMLDVYPQIAFAAGPLADRAIAKFRAAASETWQCLGLRQSVGYDSNPDFEVASPEMGEGHRDQAPASALGRWKYPPEKLGSDHLCQLRHERPTVSRAHYPNGADYVGSMDAQGRPDSQADEGSLRLPPGGPIVSIVGHFKAGNPDGMSSATTFADGAVCSGRYDAGVPRDRWTCRIGGEAVGGTVVQKVLTLRLKDGTVKKLGF